MTAPMITVRMRCPECSHEDEIMVEATLPLAALPDATKEVMRCRCNNHIPKIDKNTALRKSLASINGVPFSKLMADGLFLKPDLSKA